MRVVGSLTTIPGRYDKLLRTLRSLRSQDYVLDEIYLGIPDVSRRFDKSYPPLPIEITDLCTIIPCIDYGPLTKIVAGLLKEQDPNTIIFIFDDDRVYPPNLVSTMLNLHQKNPNIAIGSGGILFKHAFPFYAMITNNSNRSLFVGPSIPDHGLKVDAFYQVFTYIIP